LPDTLAVAVGIGPANKFLVSEHAAFFASEANRQLDLAVGDANASLASTRIYFADPRFGPTNAANASDPWLFGLKGIPVPGPTDSYAAQTRRKKLCEALFKSTISPDYTFCKLASAGHPNEKGAQKYFDQIKKFL
jgi:hypothetical protein